MFVAVDYLGPVGVGATTPQIFRAIDTRTHGKAKIYIVKFSNNKLGAKVLVNELLALRFGEVLGLCFPPGGIIEIPRETIIKSRRLLSFRAMPGQHFASEFLRGAEYLGRHNIHLAVNKEQMAGVMLFDHMFYNLDRTWNRKNLIIRREREGFKIYAIDNSHLFRRGRWTSEWLEELEDGFNVNSRRSFGLLLKHYLYPDDFFWWADKIRAVSNRQIELLVDSIPAQWLPDKAERYSLKHFIFKRRDMADQIACRLVELIPDIHWSSDFDQDI
ncbi:MAG: hypothetical protein LBR56_09630 [Sporomusaceae bacterium]|nr:hypothetical protein [Sporomusaceae bacterium]